MDDLRFELRLTEGQTVLQTAAPSRMRLPSKLGGAGVIRTLNRRSDYTLAGCRNTVLPRLHKTFGGSGMELNLQGHFWTNCFQDSSRRQSVCASV